MCGEGGEEEGQERWSDLKVDGVILRSGRVEGHWPPLPGYASARGTATGTFSTQETGWLLQSRKNSHIK